MSRDFANGMKWLILVLLSMSCLCAEVTIQVVDTRSLLKNELISEVLALQQVLLISPNASALSTNDTGQGFLLIKMNPEYVVGLLDDHEGKIIAAYLEEKLVGYALLTDLSEFTSLYVSSDIGSLELLSHQRTISPHSRYIEQIAVHPSYAKCGIGSQIIQKCKAMSSGGLVADVFISPVRNNASLAFFERMGFDSIGVLHQTARNGFVEHKTCVFYWCS